MGVDGNSSCAGPVMACTIMNDYLQLISKIAKPSIYGIRLVVTGTTTSSCLRIGGALWSCKKEQGWLFRWALEYSHSERSDHQQCQECSVVCNCCCLSCYS